MNKSSIVTAAQVREFFRADEKRIARVSEDAAKTVRKGARGRLHPEVIEAYNKGRKAEKRYVSGATGTAQAQAKAEALALRVKAFDQNLAVGARGPLSKEAQVALGLVKASKKTRKG